MLVNLDLCLLCSAENLGKGDKRITLIVIIFFEQRNLAYFEFKAVSLERNGSKA